jgi:hypothetical protein
MINPVLRRQLKTDFADYLRGLPPGRRPAWRFLRRKYAGVSRATFFRIAQEVRAELSDRQGTRTYPDGYRTLSAGVLPVARPAPVESAVAGFELLDLYRQVLADADRIRNWALNPDGSVRSARYLLAGARLNLDTCNSLLTALQICHDVKIIATIMDIVVEGMERADPVTQAKILKVIEAAQLPIQGVIPLRRR